MRSSQFAIHNTHDDGQTGLNSLETPITTALMSQED